MEKEKKDINSKNVNCQVRVLPSVAKMLHKYTLDRRETMGGFITDILYLFEALSEKPQELEKIVGKVIYKKYFEER